MPTVVIADDSPTLRRILTSVLSKEGFEIVLAEDGV
jgi:CheY-like chemotaxis protein